MNLKMDNWQETDLNVDSLWLIDERDKSGKHENIYHGNFIPQIPHQLIERFTQEEDTVLDLFMGSGTTLYECEAQKRNFIGFDINQEILDHVHERMTDSTAIQFFINNCDVTDNKAFDKAIKPNLKELKKEDIDFFIAHPPYLDIIKFTDQKEDLSQISDIDCFLSKIVNAIDNGYRYLKENKYFAVVMGDVYKNSEVIPLGFYVMYAIKKHFSAKLKGIIVKNIEGNKGKLGMQNIWKYRALKSDYYLFKHEYIFVFKKNQGK